jgi:DNA-3-methyladenine glycosylase II
LTADRSFVLEPIPPFRLDLTVWTLRRRPDNMVDRWDGQTYRRVLVDDSKLFEIAVIQLNEPGDPRLRVSVTGKATDPGIKAAITATVERLLGTQADLKDFYCLADEDELLGPVVGQFRGAKPPRFPSFFEALVNAIACQQLTLTVGIRLLNRLAKAYGARLKTEEGVFHAFPGPEELADADVEQLREMGFSYRKAHYLTGLARGITENQIDLEEIQTLDDREAVKRLCKIKGVGRWTAEYFLLRGLGRTHVFPGDDVGARNNLQRWMGSSGTMSYERARDAIKPWDGYGGLIYFNLLLKSLAEKGIIPNEMERLD